MKRSLIFIIVIIGIVVAGIAYQQLLIAQPDEKVYVAVEGESKIAVFDPAKNSIIKTIDLAIEHDGGRLPYAPHNVQVSPDMKTVWVTANAGTHEGHTSLLAPIADAHGEESEEPDEVIIINPEKDQIIKRIPIGVMLHLAHVVVAPDGLTALVTAQNEGVIYKINTQTFAVEKKIPIPLQGAAPGAPEPHGIRISPDGSMAYIALLNGRSLGMLDLKTDMLSIAPLDGAAVQSGITPDGKIAVISLYDTKQLALFDTDTKTIENIKLPDSAKGPIQMYPTPNSRFVYLADQGYYFNQPTGDRVYKIDLEKREVVKEIVAGQGPHGVVVSPDGSRVYVTNLLSDDLSIIDTATDKETNRIKIGKEPNGVSVWTKQSNY